MASETKVDGNQSKKDADKKTLQEKLQDLEYYKSKPDWPNGTLPDVILKLILEYLDFKERTKLRSLNKQIKDAADSFFIECLKIKIVLENNIHDHAQYEYNESESCVTINDLTVEGLCKTNLEAFRPKRLVVYFPVINEIFVSVMRNEIPHQVVIAKTAKALRHLREAIKSDVSDVCLSPGFRVKPSHLKEALAEFDHVSKLEILSRSPLCDSLATATGMKSLTNL